MHGLVVRLHQYPSADVADRSGVFRHGNEFGEGHLAQFGAVPSQQHLSTDDVHRRGIDSGLEA